MNKVTISDINMKQMTRILFVTNQYPTDEKPGASPCIEEQKKSLERLGFHVDVLFFDGPRSRLNYLKAMIRVFWTIQIRHQYDLVHAHYGYSGIVARAQLRRPVIVTFRGSDVLSPRERPVSRLVAGCAERVIVMSDEMRQLLGRKDAKVIPYGIDLDLFKPGSQDIARQKLGLSSGIPLILFPYDPRRTEKRYDMVNQAVTLLRKEFPQVQLLAIFGKDHQDIVDYMNACDVMVLASDSEGAPVAVREAMACNLPIVSVDVGDVAQVIQNVGGCHICSKSPVALAAKIACVLQTRKRTDGRSAAIEFDLSKSASAIALIYRELL